MAGIIKWTGKRIQMLGKAKDLLSQGKSWNEIQADLKCPDYLLAAIKYRISKATESK